MPKGLHNKYEIRRTDGSSDGNGKHAGCVYFVLDLEHDEHAIAAIRAYAKSCKKENPQLAADLESVAFNTRQPSCGCREASCPHSLVQAFSPNGPSEMAAFIIDQNEEP
jgi:hypothetical protein